MSFILTYYDNEGNSKLNAFADIQNIEMKENVKAESPLEEVKYDIDISGVEYSTTTVYNDEQFVDYEQVVQEGSNGIKKSVYQEYYIDGQLVSKSLEEETILKEPVDEIVEVGTMDYQVATSRGGFRFATEFDMVATAYDLSYESCGKYPDDPYYGITASGTKAQPGTVAVDPSVIPLGTKLYIASTDGSPDYGYATALDTGGAIKGNRVDLFMEDNTDALNFGIRQVKVYILE